MVKSNLAHSVTSKLGHKYECRTGALFFIGVTMSNWFSMESQSLEAASYTIASCKVRMTINCLVLQIRAERQWLMAESTHAIANAYKQQG